MTTAQPILTAHLAVSKIDPNPDNVRAELGDLAELAASIRQLGVLEPVVVYDHPDRTDRYVLIMGHRRLAAAKLAKVRTIPAIVRARPDEVDLLEMMLAENLHRSDLDPIDEALALTRIRSASGKARDLASIAQAVNRSKTWVAGRLALVAKVPETLWPAVRTGNLPVSTALTIVQTKGLDGTDRARLLERAASGGVSSYELDRLTASAARGAAIAKAKAKAAKAYPGATIGTDYPLGSRFGIAAIGDGPWCANIVGSGDPDVYVQVFADGSMRAWHMRPETLDPSVFVGPEPVAADAPEGIVAARREWEQLPDLVDLLAASPDAVKVDGLSLPSGVELWRVRQAAPWLDVVTRCRRAWDRHAVSVVLAPDRLPTDAEGWRALLAAADERAGSAPAHQRAPIVDLLSPEQVVVVVQAAVTEVCGIDPRLVPVLLSEIDDGTGLDADGGTVHLDSPLLAGLDWPAVVEPLVTWPLRELSRLHADPSYAKKYGVTSGLGAFAAWASDVLDGAGLPCPHLAELADLVAKATAPEGEVGDDGGDDDATDDEAA